METNQHPTLDIPTSITLAAKEVWMFFEKNGITNWQFHFIAARSLVASLEQRLAAKCEELATATAERDAARKRLDFDPGGSDKIDELESAMNLLRGQLAAMTAERDEAIRKRDRAELAILNNEKYHIEVSGRLQGERDSLRLRVEALEGACKEGIRHMQYIKEHGCSSCETCIERSKLNAEQHASNCFIHQWISTAFSALCAETNLLSSVSSAAPLPFQPPEDAAKGRYSITREWLVEKLRQMDESGITEPSVIGCVPPEDAATPRTDAFAEKPAPHKLGQVDWMGCCELWIDFARTLESELSAALVWEQRFIAASDEIAEYIRRIGANETAQLLTEAVARQCCRTAEVERERDEARGCKPDEFTHVLSSERAARSELSSLRAENAKLLADKERLDWLEAMPDNTEFTPSQYGKTIRSAIDAAKANKWPLMTCMTCGHKQTFDRELPGGTEAGFCDQCKEERTWTRSS